MVDSIGSGGQTPKVQSSDSLQKVSQKKDSKSADNSVKAASSDEVAISEEALTLSNAQQAAEQTGALLSQESDQTLSADADRLNALV